MTTIGKFVGVLLLLWSGGASAATHYYSEGKKSAPTVGTLLADTGDLTGDYECFLLLDSSVAGNLILQHRNAANNANLDTQTLTIGAAGLVATPKILLPHLDTDERMRIVVDVSFTLGAVQTTMICTP